jgi:parallel beta-helix repeat protein
MLYAADNTVSIASSVVKDNRIGNINGLAFGIRLWTYPNVRILDNSVSQTGREGIYSESSRNLEIRGNRIVSAGLRGIFAGSEYFWGQLINNQIVTDNVIVNWGPNSDGVRLNGARYGLVRNNTFRRSDGARPRPVVLWLSCGVPVDGNVALYAGTVDNVSTGPCP